MRNAMSQPRMDAFVSVVAPMRNEMDHAAAFVREIHDVLAATYANYEVIVVDDGSTDGTGATLTALLKDLDGLRLLRLSRSFGREAAILAGLDSSIGDYVVVMLPESDPVALVPEMVERCRRGSGVVVGVERQPPERSALARMASAFFHWYCRRHLGLNLHPGSRFFRVFSRSALNAILQIKDRIRNLRHLSGMVGFDADPFTYDPSWRHGQPPRRRLMEDVSEGVNVILANSRHPLRVVTALGLAASLLNLAYIAYILVVYLSKPNVAPGWTTLSLQQGLMFFLVFVILTVLSEYVGLVLWETRERPAYFVAREDQSNLSLKVAERRNVVTESH